MLAQIAISGYLTTGVPVDQPSAFAAGLERAGYAGPPDFWEAFLSGPVTIGDFIFFVSLQPFDERRRDDQVEPPRPPQGGRSD